MPPTSFQLTVLPYRVDSSTLFAPLAHQPWAMWLDSTYPHSQQGRYDIFAAEPVCTLETHGSTTRVYSPEGEMYSTRDPFVLVQDAVKQFRITQANPQNLPFIGGALGYFAYDLGRCLEKLPSIAADEEHIPDMAIGIYLWAVVVDHQEQMSYLVGQGITPEKWDTLSAQFSAEPDTLSNTPFVVTSAVQGDMSFERYQSAFQRIKHYLTEGDCYQVNLTQRFSATCEGDAWTAYQQLRQRNAAPFSCYLNLPEVQILSSSPERFLKLHDGIVETKPIKGTRRRQENEHADRQQQVDLQSSIKDRAENVMIVDLLRNDLSKTCHEVRVPSLFAIESYATVHHLVSTVTGKLNNRETALLVLRSCFPGGSITGAPKIRAMEIIEELEPHRRGVYCGTIAYISFDGSMDSNIAIRTLVKSHGTIRFWAGGGIVQDSVLEEEYQECFDKAAALLQLLNSFKA